MSGNGNGRFPWQDRDNLQAASYTRDLEATRDLPYDEKFDGFLRLCEHAAKGEFQIVVVAFPVILGDHYGELIRNLEQAARAGLLIAIAKAPD